MSMFDIKKIDGMRNPEKFELPPSTHPRFRDNEMPAIIGAVPPGEELKSVRPLPNFSEQTIDYNKYKSMPFDPEKDPINPFEGLPPAKSLEELNARFDIIWERGRKVRDYKNRKIMSRLSATSAKAMKKALEKAFS